MSVETFVIGNAMQMRRLVGDLARLTYERPWKVTLERVAGRAGVNQEAVLRGIEQKIVEHTGQDMDSVHDELLALHYGRERIRLPKTRRVLIRPARRTRTGPKPLTRDEMREHIKFAEAFAVDLGIRL